MLPRPSPLVPSAARLCLLAALAAVPAAAPRIHAQGNPAWKQTVLSWRAQREHELSAPDGWLTLIGLEWLKTGVNSIGSAPDCSVRLPAQAPPHLGKITILDSGSNPVQLLAPSGGFPAGVTVDGAPAREGPIIVSDTRQSAIAWNSLSLVVLDRGGRYALRIKDADSPTRKGYSGLHWYDPDPRYRVTAEWVPYAEPVTQKIPTVIGTTLNLPSPGYVTFTLNGKPLRLHPVLEAGEKDKLFFILRDQTSESTTYGAGRFLHTGLPTHGLDKPGYLVLDFNELYNPPCAYTPYATCPLPPEQNRLAIAIPAGEQRYLH